MHYLASLNGKLKSYRNVLFSVVGIAASGVFLITGTPERGSVVQANNPQGFSG